MFDVVTRWVTCIHTAFPGQFLLDCLTISVHLLFALNVASYTY